MADSRLDNSNRVGTPTADVARRIAALQEEHRRGRLALAEPQVREILEIAPDHGEGHHLLGAVFLAQGNFVGAVDAIERAIALDGGTSQRYSNLSLALQGAGRLDAALAACDEGLRIGPGHAASHNNRGTILLRMGDVQSAITSFERSVRLRPESVGARVNLAGVLRTVGRSQEALGHLIQASRLAPGSADVHAQTGSILRRMGKVVPAAVALLRALKIVPDHLHAWIDLGNVQVALGDPTGAVRSFERVLKLHPRHAGAHSNLLLCRQYIDPDPLSLKRAHLEWNRCHAPVRDDRMPVAHVDARPKRLRLGFVSADFARHPVGYFLIRTFEAFDRERFELICYSDGSDDDDLTARFRDASDRFVSVRGESDAQLVERIRDDDVDILIDLAGHTASNRLVVFAHRPAPFLATWIGYPGTTGLPAIDLLIADWEHIPAENDAHFVERVLRTEGPHLSFEPPPSPPDVVPPPQLERGFVTFGSFNNLAKVGDEVLAAFARILDQLPESRLRMKYTGLDDAQLADRVRARFAAVGGDGSRVDFRGWTSYSDHLTEHREIDLHLDSFPFSGGLTSLTALFMGVDVITLRGATLAGRQTAAYLQHLGRPEGIASTVDEYVSRAVEFASRPEWLTQRRSSMRVACLESTICDGSGVAREVGDRLESAWANRRRASVEWNRGEDRLQ